MATFYKIEAYDQDGRDSEDVLNSYNLYTTFEKACDAIDIEIQTLVNTYNLYVTEYEPIVYTPPNRESINKNWNRYLHYYELAFPDACYLFVINKLTVVE